MSFSLGTVSHGTLRTQDLLEAFANELKDRATGDELTPVRRELIDDALTYAKLIEADHLNDDGQEAAGEIVNELIEALTELAPAYVHFGAHEGDGSDFGFWVSWDSLEEDARYGNYMLKVSDTADVPTDYSGYVMHVTDHGNVTLYSAEPYRGGAADHGPMLTELWACV
jgi:hypothetical protein